MNNTMKKAVIGMGVGVGLFATTAQGAGFAILEQSVTGLGRAFAGTASVADDASTVFFNPAGMMRLGAGQHAAVALHGIKPEADFTDKGSTVSGTDSDDAAVGAIVPNAYYVSQMGDGMRWGVGFNAPYGLSTEYAPGWKGRYYGIDSALETLNVNPSIAFKANDNLSLGVGLNLQTAKAELTSAVNGAGVCAFLNSQNPAFSCAGPTPTDIDAEVTGSSTAWGVNFGLLYKLSGSTDVGFHYRSNMRHEIDGDADFSRVHPALLAIGWFVSGDGSATLNLPATATLSTTHRMSNVMTLSADLGWTGWSDVHELRVRFDQGNTPDSVEELGWKNTMRLAIGGDYMLNDNMTLRAGIAHDQSPTPNEERRSVRVPDADRTWISLGGSYKLNKDMGVDVGYAYISVDTPKVDKKDQLKGNLKGEYDSFVHILSIQGSLAF